MKRLMAALALSLAFSATSFAMGADLGHDSPRDIENLGFSKRLYDNYVNVKQWQIGAQDPVKVDGPEDFIRSKVGVYYTGRVMVKRWGSDMKTNILEYAWNHEKNQRWWASREAVLWDEERQVFEVFFQGPNIHSSWDRNKRLKFTRDFVGEVPDWSLFK